LTPRRLSRCGSAFDRRLLQAGRSESPALGAEQRAIRALGAETQDSGSAPHRLGDIGLRAAMGKAAVVVALATLGVTAIHALGPGGGARAPVATPAIGGPVAVATSSPTEPSHPPLAPVVAPPTRPMETRTVVPLRGRSPQSRSALAVEAALVQRAARALAEGDGAEALRALDEYGVRCQGRILGQEAGLLRVRALVAAGRNAEAKALARRLRAAHPRDALAGQLDGILVESAVP
jgi:hypothetical protein